MSGWRLETVAPRRLRPVLLVVVLAAVCWLTTKLKVFNRCVKEANKSRELMMMMNE